MWNNSKIQAVTLENSRLKAELEILRESSNDYSEISRRLIDHVKELEAQIDENELEKKELLKWKDMALQYQKEMENMKATLGKFQQTVDRLTEEKRAAEVKKEEPSVSPYSTQYSNQSAPWIDIVESAKKYADELNRKAHESAWETEREAQKKADEITAKTVMLLGDTFNSLKELYKQVFDVYTNQSKNHLEAEIEKRKKDFFSGNFSGNKAEEILPEKLTKKQEENDKKNVKRFSENSKIAYL